MTLIDYAIDLMSPNLWTLNQHVKISCLNWTLVFQNFDSEVECNEFNKLNKLLQDGRQDAPHVIEPNKLLE